MNEVKNPANGPEAAKIPEGWIPMSIPHTKLSVPDIPGFHLHWMLGTPDRIRQAHQAGYTFVEQDEVFSPNRSLASGDAAGGNTDMGSRVSVVAGGDEQNGQPVRLVLMKCPEHLWLASQKLIEDQNDRVADALRNGNLGGQPQGADTSNRYIPKGAGNRNIFTKRT